MNFSIEVPDRWQRPVLAEFVVRRDTIELRCRERIVGIADREILSAWLRQPYGVFAYDDLAWLAAGNGVALAIDDIVPAHVLPDRLLIRIREQI